MGASGWEYLTPFRDDIASALDALRRQVFAEGNFISPTDFELPEPASVDDLLEETYWEFMGTCGTHSIIDVWSIVPAEDHDQRYGTIRPLTDSEYRELFGTMQPSRDDFTRLGDTGRLQEYMAGRGTGRAAVLWQDGHPSEIAFWGYSGD